MRLDYVTIFPAYFDTLTQSLTGRASQSGLIDVHVHDLRAWTHDRHRTVDDTPYGGGAGMVMKPEPWGEALDDLLTPHPDDDPPDDPPDEPSEQVGRVAVVVPTPAGRPLTQALARDLATRDRLVFACGRYEGIDQRVLDLLADPPATFGRPELIEVSLGDYVLNGGEVAALAVTEAVARLLPGFVGNAESLTEESHEAGLLEYPVYTRPASWRGHDVPPVLMSGDHAAVAAWRDGQSRWRTAARRPDLLHPAAAATGADEWPIRPATRADAGELLTLQLACWVTEAIANDDLAIPALQEDLADVVRALGEWRVDVVRVGGRLVGSVRGRLDGEVWHIGRLMVAPDLRGRGLGRVLLAHVQAVAPEAATSYRLFTGTGSAGNLRMYRRAGFRVTETLSGASGPVVLDKIVRRAPDRPGDSAP